VSANEDAVVAAATHEAEAWIAAAEAEAVRDAASRGGSCGPSRAGSVPGSLPGSLPGSVPGSASGSATASTVASPTRSAHRVRAAPPLTRDELAAELQRTKPSAAAVGARAALRLTKHVEPSASSARTLALRHEACRATLSEPSLALRLFYGAPLAQLETLLETVRSLPHQP
jgi:hypothetical protein